MYHNVKKGVDSHSCAPMENICVLLKCCYFVLLIMVCISWVRAFSQVAYAAFHSWFLWFCLYWGVPWLEATRCITCTCTAWSLQFLYSARYCSARQFKNFRICTKTLLNFKEIDILWKQWQHCHTSFNSSCSDKCKRPWIKLDFAKVARGFMMQRQRGFISPVKM